MDGHAVDPGEALDEEGTDGVFVRVPLFHIQVGDHLGGPGQGGGAEDIGGAAFMPGGDRWSS